MNRDAFLSAVEARLKGLSPEEQRRWLDYYGEMIDDRVEDGLSEEEAVAAMGSAEEVAAQILMDTPLAQLVKARVKSERKLRPWEIVLLVLGSPVWVPLLATAAILLLTLYLLIWVLVLLVYVLELSFAAVSLAGFAGCVMTLLNHNGGSPLFLLGVGIACAGLTVLGWFACAAVTKGCVRLSRSILKKLKTCIVGKGESHE